LQYRENKWGQDMTNALRGVAMGLAVTTLLALPAQAEFKVPGDEADKLKACEATVCGLIVKKGPADGPLTCEVSKTWGHQFIEDGVKEKSFKWGLGDARCALKLEIGRDLLLKALSEPDYVLQMPPHTASCDAETGSTVTSVKITLAPKITFKGGKATSATLGVGQIEAPAAVTAVIWSAAKIEDTIGLFQGQLLREINNFVEKRCLEVAK
jgi:hypothetical protein